MHKFIFASLLCHRDIDIFKFTWFTQKIHLDHGFDIPHLIVNDGTLTEDDFKSLRALPNVIVDETPITLYNIPNPALTGKLECFSRGFSIADRVIITDPDVFFYRSWDSVLRKILTSDAICLRDWGSSIGWGVDKYKELFGCQEDLISPNCNTGVYSIPREQYFKIPPVLRKHINNPFQIMEDQGIFFAAYYGMLEYITDIQCITNGLENIDYVWGQILHNTVGSHLQGMRVRPRGVVNLIDYCIKHFPRSLPLKQFTPKFKDICLGLLSHGAYSYVSPLQAYPSQYKGRYIVDGMYLHAGSTVEWQLPKQFNWLETKVVCMDTGKPMDCKTIIINGRPFYLEDDIRLPLDGTLKIQTEFSEGGHLCFLKPTLKVEWPIPEVVKGAVYGYGASVQGPDSSFVNVTHFLNVLSIYGKIELRVDNNLFGDPAYGKAKELSIVYNDGRVLEIPENSNFIFNE